MKQADIYDMINDTRTDAPEAPLTAAERQRFLAVMKSAPTAKKQRSRKGLYALAMAAVILLAALHPLSRQAVADGMFKIASLSQSQWTADRGGDFIANYATSIGEPAAFEGGKMRVDGAVVDEDLLMLNVLIEPDTPPAATDVPKVDLVRVAVDGRPMHPLSGGGGIGPMQEGVFQSEMTYQFDEAFPQKPFTLTLDYAASPFSLKVTRFECRIDPAALAKDTLAKTLNIPLAKGFTLQSMKWNALQQAFIITHPDPNFAKDYELFLRGTDEAGHLFEFGMRTAEPTEDGHYRDRLSYEYNLSDATVSPEALVKEKRTLTLQLYMLKIPEDTGRIDHNQAVPAGKPFTLQIH